MGRRRPGISPEQIITALREAEVALANGKTVGEVGRQLRVGSAEQTYYRWRKEFGGTMPSTAMAASRC